MAKKTKETVWTRKNKDMIEQVKKQLDPLFELDNEEGREMLEDLADYITYNLKNF